MEKDHEIFKAAVYVRLSKEDIDRSAVKKAESNSISNQKQLIFDYLQEKPEIEIVSVRVDDGYTGTNYNRPAFQLMLEDIKAGRINCVVVKDLSRFGREYIDAGKYISRIFPYYGVRLISINDNIDTITCDPSDEFNITVRNLFNDNYCRDISMKIRSQLHTKRKNGEFLGAFAPYGYQKSKINRNQLEVDAYAAAVVQDIFRWKVEGMNNDGIVRRLNAQGILSPLEYKRSQGMKYESGFQLRSKALWEPSSIRRILTNEIYIGTLTQGVRTTPNYKIKKRLVAAPEEWVRIPDHHEAIISSKTFQLVQKLLRLDTRTSPQEDFIFPLSGLLFCGDCGSPMVRKISTVKGKKYTCYICSQHKAKQICSSHRIKASVLTETVLRLLQEHIALICEIDACFAAVDRAPFHRATVKKAEERLLKVEEEIQRYTHYKVNAYEDFKDGVLSKDDYSEIREQYDQRIQEALNAKDQLSKENETLLQSETEQQSWITDFLKYKNIQELNRCIAVECVDHIQVWEDNRIAVQFSHSQDYVHLLDQVKEMADTEGGGTEVG